MAFFDMYMSIRVHVRSWSTAPLISGFKVSKQIVFGMGSLGWISSWRKSGYKRENTHTERERQRDRERETDEPTDRKTAALAGV